MSDELTGILGTIEGLRVAARVDAPVGMSTKLDVQNMGETFGVSAVLHGSIQGNADRVRITPMLVSTHNDSILWTATYDRSPATCLRLRSRF